MSKRPEPEIDGDEIIDLGDETEQVLAEMKKTLESEQETELAFYCRPFYQHSGSGWRL